MGKENLEVHYEMMSLSGTNWSADRVHDRVLSTKISIDRIK